ncbi:MAG: hypothetical protein IPM54_00030 [Polyangiaceae bacterium]|nr:hypothetical protein [Polyangiaceae bacterium]
MTTHAHNYVSAIFSNLIDPIVELHESMLRHGGGPPNDVQAAPAENGFVVAIVSLVVFMIEGACGRARYVLRLDNSQRRTPVETLRDLGAADLCDDVEEIFVVRDAVAHSHLWTAAVVWDQDRLQFRDDPDLLPTYGDRKFDRIVNRDTRKTQRLGLDVFPTRIHRHTAITALKVAVAALRFLESKDRRITYLEPVHVFVRGEDVPFYQWVDSLSD